jgi:hypothetical protein
LAVGFTSFSGRNSLREVHAPKEGLETGIGAQGVPALVFEVNQLAMVLLIGLLQPF